MTTKTNSSRRRFLAALGVGGAAAAAVIAQQNGQKPEPSSAGPAARQGKGYQLTAHVRNYYRTARI